MHTRALVRAALSSKLENVPTREDPRFGLLAPMTCPEVPDPVLGPETSWDDKAAQQAKGQELAGRFHDNFAQFEGDAPAAVGAAGPR